MAEVARPPEMDPQYPGQHAGPELHRAYTEPVQGVALESIELSSIPPSPVSAPPGPVQLPPRSQASLYALPPRKNGFQPPLHSAQLTVWACLVMCWIIYFGLCIPFIPENDAEGAVSGSGGGGRSTEFFVALLLYIGIIVVGMPCYIIVQARDPRLTLADAKPHPVASSSSLPGQPLAPVCDKCNLFKGPRTKHCHLCHKCIDGFDHHCIAAGSLVSLASGKSVPIEQVRRGDVVLSRGEPLEDAAEVVVPRAVQALMPMGTRDCVELLFDDGRTLVCTADHRLLSEGEWRAAGELRVGGSFVSVIDHLKPGPRSNAVTYGAHRDATDRWPTFRVRLVARRSVGLRPVFDLAVPARKGGDDRLDSFCANGVLAHNCLYLNTCVGRKNYRVFMATLTATVVLLVLQLYVSISLLVRAGRNDAAVMHMISSSALSTRWAFIPLLAALSTLPLTVLLAVGSLWAFHLFIIVQSKTTYEFIMDRRKKAEDKKLAQEEKERAARGAQLTAARAQEEAEWLARREVEKKRRAGTRTSSADRSEGLSRPNVRPIAVSSAAAVPSVTAQQPPSHSNSSSIEMQTLLLQQQHQQQPLSSGGSTVPSSAAPAAAVAVGPSAPSSSAAAAASFPPLTVSAPAPGHEDAVPSPQAVRFHLSPESPLLFGGGRDASADVEVGAAALAQAKPHDARAADEATAIESTNPWLTSAAPDAYAPGSPAEGSHTFLVPMPPEYPHAQQPVHAQQQQAPKPDEHERKSDIV